MISHTMFAPAKNPYKFHKMALAPLVTEEPQIILNSLKNLDRKDQERLVDFILASGLGPLWNELLYRTKKSRVFYESLLGKIKATSRLAAIGYLAQHQTLFNAAAIFKKEAISYAVYKGVHIREIIYDKPAIRTAADIDILIATADKEQAIRALTGAGYSFHSSAGNVSHEVTLADGNSFIDLHWHILGPGRLRKDMTNDFLATRREFPNHCGLSNEATLFIMLVHPVFAKYSTTPQASLVRMVDLVRWTQTQKIDWEMVSTWLRECGMQTAAWITTDYLHFLTGITLPAPFIRGIQPSKARAAYLRKWTHLNLASHFLNHPLIIKAGYTIPAHDTIRDAARAIWTLIQEKKAVSEKTKALQKVTFQ